MIPISRRPISNTGRWRLRAFALGVGVAVLVLSAAAKLHAEQTVFGPHGSGTLLSARTPLGPTAHGFGLSLTADQPAITLGSPIWVTVELRPASLQRARVEYGSRHTNYTFRIASLQDGLVAPALQNLFGLATLSGPQCGRQIPDGDSIFGRFQLDEMYAITKPGRYSITVSGMPIIECTPVKIQSNTISITIRPGKPQVAATQPPLPVVQRICLPTGADYVLHKWNFINPYLLCSAGDQNTGGEVLFVRDLRGSFSQISTGGGDLTIPALEFWGVPSDVAKALILGMHP